MDREQVIEGLERIKNWATFSQTHGCFRLMRDDLDKITKYATDALALLKEQEPRVLTLEEVKNNCPDYMYIEIVSGWLNCAIKDEAESDLRFGRFAYGIDQTCTRAWKDYKTSWRCWTARPTDEQREAIRWEAVEPLTYYDLFICPVCNNTLFRGQKFCYECGERIEWERR